MRTILSRWPLVATFAARLILAVLFLMAATFKFIDTKATAAFIDGIGWPFPLFFAIGAGAFEIVIAVGLLWSRLTTPISLLAALYVLVLGALFHGPATWSNPLEFSIFTYHFVFVAALLLTATSFKTGRTKAAGTFGTPNSPESRVSRLGDTKS